MDMESNIVFRECVEQGAEKISERNVKLDDEQYERAMLAFPVLCADVLPINRERKVVYLAPRNLRPKRGWWTLGGRVLRGEPFIEAARRKLKQEAGLEIEAARLMQIAFHRYVCVDREQVPHDTGTDTPTMIFIFEPTEEELDVMSSKLDPKEYEGSKGMREFTRHAMVDAQVDPHLVVLYDQIFAR